MKRISNLLLLLNLFTIIIFLFSFNLLDKPVTAAVEKPVIKTQVINDCTFNGINLCGKVEFVDAFPDLKIEIVTSFPDLKVQMVDAFPDECGKWQKVDAFPDFKVQVVDAFADIKIEYVDAFPGMP